MLFNWEMIYFETHWENTHTERLSLITHWALIKHMKWRDRELCHKLMKPVMTSNDITSTISHNKIEMFSTIATFACNRLMSDSWKPKRNSGEEKEITVSANNIIIVLFCALPCFAHNNAPESIVAKRVPMQQ